MKRFRPLLTIAALALFVTALAPAASAHPITPIRADGTATFVGTGWAGGLTGDLDCTTFEVAPEIRIVGDIPFVEGTMHWLSVLTLTCGGDEMVIVSNGIWTFANGKWRANGSVVDATGAYEHLIGASAHQSGMADPVAFTAVFTLRIN